MGKQMSELKKKREEDQIRQAAEERRRDREETRIARWVTTELFLKAEAQRPLDRQDPEVVLKGRRFTQRFIS